MPKKEFARALRKTARASREQGFDFGLSPKIEMDVRAKCPHDSRRGRRRYELRRRWWRQEFLTMDTLRSTSTESRSTTPPFWATAIATFFGVGRLKPGPGTWGSAAAVLLWAAVARSLPPGLRVETDLALAVLAAGIGIPAATRVSRAWGNKDPQSVVIDEVAGQLIALIGVPLAWKTFLASFILFRAFDIVKPPPVRQLEKLPEGAGIVLDDVAAGICAFVVMQLILHSGLLK
jgi:phosphatidylglycerophosphatase A